MGLPKLHKKFFLASFDIYRGYYMVARRYEVYHRVEKIFHEWVQRASEIFFPQEDTCKLHIFKPTCNFLFITQMSVSKIKKKPWQQTKKKQRSDVSDIFTSEDMENISLVSQM